MNTCVIFNPTAKGDKARRFRAHLDEIGAESALKQTTCAGDAHRLATEAVREGFKTIVAAGGDGTLNEVLNGIVDSPGGLESVRLGLLPLGTVNVFARELGLPTKLELAWKIIRAGNEWAIDLPEVEFVANGTPQRRAFAQLAGAGLDARAIELVNWELKKRVGPLAYIAAGLNALREGQSEIKVSVAGKSETGQLVLLGNGRLYGGNYRLFPEADLKDGLIEVCVFPKANWSTLVRCGPGLLLSGSISPKLVRTLRGETVTLSSAGRVPLEVDGELVGQLPATFRLRRRALRVLAA